MCIKKILLTIFVLITIATAVANDNKFNYAYDHSKLDSLDLQISPLIANKEFNAAAVLMLKKGRLLLDYGMYINSITVFDNALEILSKCKDTNNVEYKDTYVDCLNYRGVSLSYMSNFDPALECYIKIDKYNNKKNAIYTIKAYNGMGIVFGMCNNVVLSEEYFRKALSVAKKTPSYNLFPIYSNLGSVLMFRKQLDSALVYFLYAHKIALMGNDVNKEIVSLQSLGMINFQLGRRSQSLKYYNEASELSIKENNYSQLSFLKRNIIDNYIASEDYELALQSAKEALSLARQVGSSFLESSTLKQLSVIYENLGNYRLSLNCLKRGISIGDSIFNHESEDKLLRQKTDFDLYRVAAERALTDNQLALDSANLKINNMIVWFSFTLLLILLLITTIILVRQYQLNRRLNNEIKDIKTDDEIRQNELKDEIDMKSRELMSTSLLIANFNELSSLLHTKIRILKANLTLKGKDMEVIREIETLISDFSSEKRWEQFQLHFEQMSPKFYDKLDILYPDMSLGEKRICALISLNLTSKEIASLMGKNVGAIETSKSRIKKKMKIDSEINIADILLQIKY